MSAVVAEHETEVEAAVAQAIAAEIDCDLADEPLGSGYDEGPVLEHDP